MRISDWSSDVCSSDLFFLARRLRRAGVLTLGVRIAIDQLDHSHRGGIAIAETRLQDPGISPVALGIARRQRLEQLGRRGVVTQERSEEHPSELQSLMRISYAVFCLKKKKYKIKRTKSIETL